MDQEDREDLWTFLGDAKSQLTVIGRNGVKSGELTCLSLKCQFLMTLMILRRNYEFADMCHRFDLSHNSVVSVFKTWLMFLHFKFNEVEVAGDLTKPPPSAFRNDVRKFSELLCNIEKYYQKFFVPEI